MLIYDTTEEGKSFVVYGIIAGSSPEGREADALILSIIFIPYIHDFFYKMRLIMKCYSKSFPTFPNRRNEPDTQLTWQKVLLD